MFTCTKGNRNCSCWRVYGRTSCSGRQKGQLMSMRWDLHTKKLTHGWCCTLCIASLRRMLCHPETRMVSCFWFPTFQLHNVNIFGWCEEHQRHNFIYKLIPFSTIYHEIRIQHCYLFTHKLAVTPPPNLQIIPNNYHGKSSKRTITCWRT